MATTNVTDYTKKQLGEVEGQFRVVLCPHCSRLGLDVGNRIDHLVQPDGVGRGDWLLDECSFINGRWKNAQRPLHSAKDLESLASQCLGKAN